MQIRSTLILLTTLSAACGDRAYKLIDVPSCQMDPSPQRSGFTVDMRWVYSSGDGHGTGPLSGVWPTLGLGVKDAVSDSRMLLAVVACPTLPAAQGFQVTTVSSHPPDIAGALTTDTVPQLCPGQRVLFHDTLTATDDATARSKGYDGVLHFPALDLACIAGPVIKSTTADIEPRV
jgi:hypothetical protein